MEPGGLRHQMQAYALVTEGLVRQEADPSRAVALLSEGAAGYAYLLKDRVGEGDQLARAVREVASGGSMLDPQIVQGLTTPVTADSSLSAEEEDLLQSVAEGKSFGASVQPEFQEGYGKRQLGGSRLP